jgi:hypothetical protein
LKTDMALFKKNKKEEFVDMDDSQLETFAEDGFVDETQANEAFDEYSFDENAAFEDDAFAVDDSFDSEDSWSEDEIASAKIEEGKNNTPVLTLIAALVAFVLAGFLFIWMVVSWQQTTTKTENELRAANATVAVVTTSVAIDEYEELTIPKILASVQYTKVYKDSIPEGAITNWEDLIGLTTLHKLPKGAIITHSDLENFQSQVENGMVAITIPLGDLSYKNGGDIRAGDDIILAQISAEMGYQEFYELTVYQLLDASGIPQETAATASLLRMIVPAGDVAGLYETVALGGIIMSKSLK